jgi:hypothetical protein
MQIGPLQFTRKVAYACVFVLVVLLALILRFDIIPQGGRKQILPKCEWCGPLAVLPAAIGMSLEFRVEFDPAVIALTWVFVFVAYILQLIYSLRILEVVLPDEKFEGLGERLGAAWLPESWNKVGLCVWDNGRRLRTFGANSSLGLTAEINPAELASLSWALVRH